MNTLIILFYRIVAFFTRVPEKTRALHKGENSSKEILRLGRYPYIENQALFSAFKFGKGSLANFGCGPIAAFNALVSLGGSHTIDDLSDIISTFEKKGATLSGKFGTSPLCVRKYIEGRGYKTGAISSGSHEKLNAFEKDYDAFITIFRNNSKSLMDGLHYVCINKAPNGYFITHNPNHVANSFSEAILKCSSKPAKNVYTIGIKNGSKEEN